MLFKIRCCFCITLCGIMVVQRCQRQHVRGLARSDLGCGWLTLGGSLSAVSRSQTSKLRVTRLSQYELGESGSYYFFAVSHEIHTSTDN